MTVTRTTRQDARVVSGDGGWALHVVCVVCKAEATFRGVVMGLAADRAAKAGWTVDEDALYAPAHERYATCPRH